MVDVVWLIPALPLVGFLTLAFLGRRIGEPLAGWFATAMVAGSFVTALVAFAGLWGLEDRSHEQVLFTWIPAGDFQVDLGFLLDPLSMTMVLFITGVASLIHLYSIGYMHGDERFSVFFTYLNLFVFSMLMLVLGNNLLVTFLGWEGVGACSYLLISFWFTKEANASAGKKAFITNRVGDWGFMVAMFATFFAFGSLTYTEFLPLASGLAEGVAALIALMLFVGAVGKSAQIPLYLWLPDAMAGPTPVSALIHAATMVTAGVYLMTRVNPVLAAAPETVLFVIALIGALTALLAATIATSQHDIKKVLAYSTISQLGYMFLAVGSGAYVAAVFHMITHAFFKACLFLGAGSVIHGMTGEQDMRFMGGLRRLLPITSITFIVAWLAISGIPPFSGFWSKDEILEYAYLAHPVLAAIGLIAALITAYYMSRAVFLTFYTTPRYGEHAVRQEVPVAVGAVAGAPGGEEEADAQIEVSNAEVAADAEDAPSVTTVVELANGVPVEGHEPVLETGFHPHESPWVMTFPLVVLAILAAVGGLLNLPISGMHYLGEWLAPVVAPGETTNHVSTQMVIVGAVISSLFAIAGVLLAARLILRQRPGAVVDTHDVEFFEKGWYLDIGLSRFMGGPGRRLFEAIAWFDRTVIDGAVNGVGAGAVGIAQWLRRLQSGYARRYALGVTLGAVAMLAFALTRVLVR